MFRTGLIVIAAAGLLAACGNKNEPAAPVEGPMVSAPEAPMNPAISTADGGQGGALTAGANSFTEAQARSAIEKQGYSDISALAQDEQGIWSATAHRNGAIATVSVDYKGVVTAS